MFQQKLNRYSSSKGSILFYEPTATPDRRGPLNVGVGMIERIALKNGYDVDHCFFDGIKKGFRTLSGRGIREFDIIAVSIIYHLQALNLWPFLKQTTEKQIKIIGGSACYNPAPSVNSSIMFSLVIVKAHSMNFSIVRCKRSLQKHDRPQAR